MKRITNIETNYINKVLQNDFKTSKNSIMMKEFEEEFKRKIGSKYCISFINGTATMHAALEAMEIGYGDEVIVPPLTMSSTTFAVLQCNATPVFADVCKDTFQIDPVSIEKKITIKTKAIITVALYGLCPDYDLIKKIIKNKNIKIIEDNAECFLGKYKGKTVGTLGNCASFSFQSSKHLTSGEGGTIVTDNKSLANKIRSIQSLGYSGLSSAQNKILKKDIQNPNYNRHISMGWNYRMPELCCAVALAQTQRIQELVNQRIKSAKLFNNAAKEFQLWFKPQLTPKGYKNVYWTWAAVKLKDDLKWNRLRNKFIEFGGDGIYAAWKLTYLEPMFTKLNLLGREKYISKKNLQYYKKGLCPNAEWLQPRIFQFKTNYWNISDANKQADILFKTLKYFN